MHCFQTVQTEQVYSVKVMCIFFQCFYSLNGCFDFSKFFKWPGIFWIEIILLFQVTTTDTLVQRGVHKQVVYFSSVFWYMHLDCSLEGFEILMVPNAEYFTYLEGVSIIFRCKIRIFFCVVNHYTASTTFLDNLKYVWD